MGIRVDASQLRGFGRTLIGSTARTRALTAAAVKKAAVNVKQSIQDDVAGSANPGMRRIQIGFDMQSVGAGVAADISPREGGASDLANIAFFGTARGGGTHRFYEHAEAELPALADYVGRAVSEAWS